MSIRRITFAKAGVAALALSFIMMTALTGCPTEDSPPAFVAVTGITGVTVQVQVNTDLTLGGTVEPSGATNKTIVWSKKTDGGTNSTITNGKLNATAAGTVVVTAAIANGATGTTDYIQDFDITVYAAGQVPTVSSVAVNPAAATVAKGGSQPFTATVTGTYSPSQSVTWSITATGAINGGTSITSGGLLTVAAAETNTTLTVKATSNADNTKSNTATVTVGGGTGGGVVPADLIGKWEGSGTGTAGKYIEFTSNNKLEIRATAADTATVYTVTSVSGSTVNIQSAGANTSDGSFKYTLDAAKTVMTVSEQSAAGSSVGYATYTKQAPSSGDQTLSGTIKIQKGGADVTTANTGDTLTAVYTVYSGGSETGLSYQWKNGTANVGTDATTFAVTEAGSYTVTVSKTGYTSKTSTAVTVTAPWTAVSDSTFYTTTSINGIAWGGVSGEEKFVAVGSTNYGNKIAHSPDGVTWTPVSGSIFSGSSSSINGIAWGGAAGEEKFVAVGYQDSVYGGGRIVYSLDGVTWEASIISIYGSNIFGSGSEYSINGIAWGGGKFVAVGNTGKIGYSPDGVTWTEVSGISGIFGGFVYSINGIAWGGGKFVAVGDRGQMAYSTDGVTWTAVEDSKFDIDSYGYSDININGIAWGGGKFVAVGTNGKMAYSTDGVTWTAVSGSAFDSDNINGIAWGGASGAEKFVAVGAYAKMAYWDGQ